MLAWTQPGWSFALCPVLTSCTGFNGLIAAVTVSMRENVEALPVLIILPVCGEPRNGHHTREREGADGNALVTRA